MISFERLTTANTESDLAHLQALARRIWLDNYADMISASQIEYMLDLMYSQDRIKEELAGAMEWVLVNSDEKLIGYLAYELKEEELFLSKIYLSSDFQGKGIAIRMLEYVVSKAKEARVASIFLTVNKRNHRAKGFYEKHGFVQESEIDLDIGNGYVMDDYIYRLVI